MVKPLNKIGVLLGKRDEGKVARIEKWPII
jgi:hypothetical protein